MGISTQDIAQTLQYGLSGQRMGYFYMNGKQYEILAEINRQQRNKPADLRSIYLRNDEGTMVQLDNLITLEENVAPPQLYHYNRFLSATISTGLAKGRTIGEGLDEMDRIAREVLPDDFRTALAGDSKTIRMPFLATRPMSMMMPIWLKMFIVCPAPHMKTSAPAMASGTVSMMTSGSLKLSNCAARIR